MDIYNGKTWRRYTLVNSGKGKTVLVVMQWRPVSMDTETGIMSCVLLVHAAEKITIHDAAKWASRAVELYREDTKDDTPIAIGRIELDYPTYQNDAYAPWRGKGK